MGHQAGLRISASIRGKPLWRGVALTAGALALLMTVTGSASAAAVIYTYKGTVGAVVDGNSNFGAIIHRGDQFTATFTRDDVAGSTQVYEGAPFETSKISGSSISNPMIANIIIGTYSFDFGSNPNQTRISSEQFQSDYSFFGSESFSHKTIEETLIVSGNDRQEILESIYFNVFDRPGNSGNYLSSADYHSLSNLTSIDTPLFAWQGSVQFRELRYHGAGELVFFSNAQIILSPTSLTVSSVPGGEGGVPEPATWALMIGGFGMVGATLRRRAARARTTSPC